MKPKCFICGKELQEGIYNPIEKSYCSKKCMDTEDV